MFLILVFLSLTNDLNSMVNHSDRYGDIRKRAQAVIEMYIIAIERDSDC